jgi:CRP-like cAMP-binding protein
LENLKNKILSFTHVDAAEIDYLFQFYRKIRLKKGETLIRPGEEAHSFYYLNTGCINYYKIEEGEIRVLEFYTEDVFFTDLYAYVLNKPTTSFLQATEDTLVYAIDKTDVENCFRKSHQLERFGRLSMQDAFVRTFTRVERLNNRTNEERYLRLLRKRPELFQRVPQYLIASYLGLTPVGLSKIKKRLVKS